MEFKKPPKLLNYKKIVDQYKLSDNELTAIAIRHFVNILVYSNEYTNVALEVVNNKEYNSKQKEFALYFISHTPELYLEYKEDFDVLTKECYQLTPINIYENYISNIQEYKYKTHTDSKDTKDNKIKAVFQFIKYRTKYLMNTQYIELPYDYIDGQYCYNDNILSAIKIKNLEISKIKEYCKELENALTTITLNPLYNLRGLDKIYKERNTLTQNQIFMLNEILVDFDFLSNSEFKDYQDFFLNVVKDDYSLQQINSIFRAFHNGFIDNDNIKKVINPLYTPYQISIIGRLIYYKYSVEEVKRLIPVHSHLFYENTERNNLTAKLYRIILENPNLQKYINTNISEEQLKYILQFKDFNIHSDYISNCNLDDIISFYLYQKALELGINEDWAVYLGHTNLYEINRAGSLESLVNMFGTNLDELKELSDLEFKNLSEDFYNFCKNVNKELIFIEEKYNLTLSPKDFSFIANMDKYNKNDNDLYFALKRVIHSFDNKDKFIKNLDIFKKNITYLENINYNELSSDFQNELYDQILSFEDLNNKKEKTKSNDLER